ncbi:MAG: hypothetical protein JKX70_06775 [Phycisphaerales bacterium]|nr:hypothetical protein [Phycisphaerales bacterium]
MTLKNMKKMTVLGAVMAMGMSLPAMAGFTVDYDAALDFPMSTNLNGIVGTGIPNAHFVKAVNADEGIEIGLKAHARFQPTALPVSGENYFAQRGVFTPPGESPGSTWNYTLAVDLGGRPITDFQIDIFVDFNPAAGVADFTNIDLTQSAILLGGGAVTRFGDSQNLDFSFWQSIFMAPEFDPNAVGEYEIILSVRRISTTGGRLDGELLGEVSNTVVVVPLPSAALAGLGMLGGLGAYRRIRR